MTTPKSAADRYPDATYVGDHLVVDRTEWVPGEHPDPHLRRAGQETYLEAYLRCLRCGEERLREADFPPTCEGSPTTE